MKQSRAAEHSMRALSLPCPTIATENTAARRQISTEENIGFLKSTEAPDIVRKLVRIQQTS